MGFVPDEQAPGPSRTNTDLADDDAEEEQKFGGIGRLPPSKPKTEKDLKLEEELRRRGSVDDRAMTIKLAISPEAKPTDFIRPGHVFPLKAKPGGVLERAGHTEASVDLARLAGLYPAGVICEIMKEDGTMARLPDLMEFAKKFNLKIITIADLIRYRLKRERLVVREATANLPTRYGFFKIHAYRHVLTGEEQVALTMGEWKEDEPVLVRVT